MSTLRYLTLFKNFQIFKFQKPHLNPWIIFNWRFIQQEFSLVIFLRFVYLKAGNLFVQKSFTANRRENSTTRHSMKALSGVNTLFNYVNHDGFSDIMNEDVNIIQEKEIFSGNFHHKLELLFFLLINQNKFFFSFNFRKSVREKKKLII